MKWALVQVVFLVLALVASNSACAMTCSAQPCRDHGSVPPCHQKHGVATCDHVLPVADMAVAATPAPDLMVVEVTAVAVVVHASWNDPADYRPWASASILRI
jgi:hypothetical protein